MTDAEQEIYDRELKSLKEYIKLYRITDPEEILEKAFDKGVSAGNDMLMTKTLQDIYDDGYEAGYC